MNRQELIRFIKANDSNYANMTFAGYSTNDLFLLRQKMEEEKRKENQSYQMHSVLLNLLQPVG
jgi:hypothetical protein